MPDALLDATAEALAGQILRDLPADAPRTRAQVAALPAPVAGLLHARLDARVDRAAAPPDTPWVDADDEAVRRAVGAWRDAARAAGRFPAAAWAEAVERATRLALAHLVRPAPTLAAYAFEGDDETLPAALALRRIRDFGPYPYLPDIAARYADRKGLGRIDRDGLERLLQRIDRRMVRSFGADDWLTLLGPLYALVGPLGSPPGTVPAPLLQSLFRARGADALADAVDGAGPLAPDALRQRLADALPEAEPAAPPEILAPAAVPPAPISADPPAPAEAPASALRAPEAPPSPADVDGEAPSPPVIGSAYRPPAEQPADDSDVIGPARPAQGPVDAGENDEPEDAPAPALVFPQESTEPASAPAPSAAVPPEEPEARPAPTAEPPADADDEPLWRRLAREQGGVEDEEAPTEADNDEAPLWKRFAQPGAARPEAPAAPSQNAARPLDALEARVLGAHAAERRAWFVDELFGGSADGYRQTLAALDGVRTWTEATQIIARDVFRQHRVNIYSEPAVAFTDAVEAQMNARG